MNGQEQQEYLKDELLQRGASLVGFADMSGLDSELTTRFPTAISIAVKYDSIIVENLHIAQDAFHLHLIELDSVLMEILGACSKILSGWGYDYYIPPISVPITNDADLKELKTFSHKLSATRAALGWIGKCSLVVTPQYGPRIKLATVLTNAYFQTAEPISKGKCGNCNLCAEACPYGAIHGVNWDGGMKREALIDVYRCNQKRLDYITDLGRKYDCGLCLQACRVGKNKKASG